MKSKVYFIEDITKENVVKIFKCLNKKFEGNVGVKVHSGEKGNQNFLKPEFLEPIINYLDGTVIETNTAYVGERDTTEKHLKLLKDHGWSDLFKVDILDSDKDIVLDINNGRVITKNYVGANMTKYDSILVISHFKGHPMGGYGGALKQLSIGFASSMGKRFIHCCGKENAGYEDMFGVEQNKFLEAMADAASSIVDYYKDNIVYINIMSNMSIDCDCCKVAHDPKIKDIGILASCDPVALDKACIDLVYNSKDEGKKDLIERIESRNGTYIIDVANEIGMGNTSYELIKVD